MKKVLGNYYAAKENREF